MRKRWILVGMVVLGGLVLAACTFLPGNPPAPPGIPLMFTADRVSGAPAVADGGFRVVFTAEGGTGEYLINFGDGITGIPTSSLAHIYSAVGVYIATCFSGTETATLQITVENSPCGALYQPFITGPLFWNADESTWDLRINKRFVLDGRYFTVGIGANKKFFGAEKCGGYELTYEWHIILTSLCGALTEPRVVYGSGPVVIWWPWVLNPPVDPDLPTLTSAGSVGPLAGPPPPPYGDRVGKAEITLKVTDQFGSTQAKTFVRWVSEPGGCS